MLNIQLPLQLLMSLFVLLLLLLLPPLVVVVVVVVVVAVIVIPFLFYEVHLRRLFSDFLLRGLEL